MIKKLHIARIYINYVDNDFALLPSTLVQEQGVTIQNLDDNTCINIQNDAISSPPYNSVLLAEYLVKKKVFLTEYSDNNNVFCVKKIFTHFYTFKFLNF